MLSAKLAITLVCEQTGNAQSGIIIDRKEDLFRDMTESPRQSLKADGQCQGAARDAGPPEAVVSSAALMNGQREIVIVHAGLRYRLRITANDKLILTK